MKVVVGLTSNCSMLASFELMKLCVDPLYINTTILYGLILAMTRIIWGASQPVNAYKEILGWTDSPGSPAISSPMISSWTTSLGNSSLSRSSSCALVHLWPAVNFSLHLKHNPCVRRCCISSHDNRLKGTEGEARFEAAGGRLTIGGRSNFRWWDI